MTPFFQKGKYRDDGPHGYGKATRKFSPRTAKCCQILASSLIPIMTKLEICRHISEKVIQHSGRRAVVLQLQF